MPITPAMMRGQMADPTARPVRTASRERSTSDITITPENSLTVSAVLAAFTILTEDLSSLPLMLYTRRGRNKFRAYDSAYYRLMHDTPNPEHTSMVFREFVVGHLMAWGNFYGQLIVDKRGDVQEIWPLRPDRMTVERKNGERVYIYQTSEGKPRVFFSDELLHIPAFGFDGMVGYSRISLARNSIGLAMSTEAFGSKLFANGANPGVIYKHPGTLSPGAYENLQKSLEERKGVDNAHKTVILEEGMSIEKLGIPPDDAQFLETRKFQVSEIARIFRVPPHMIGDVERSTSWGSGIDAQEQGYVNHTLRPWATRIEQSLNAKVLLEKDRADYFYEHLMDGLLRGDIATRYASYVSAINNGIMSPNEVRSKENMNPYAQGDVYWRPMNMANSADVNAASNDGVNTSASLAPLPLSTAAAPHLSTNGGSVLEPLWKDAIARVMKREANDVLGAARRFAKKNDADGFEQWAGTFYRHDHGAFMAKQFTPVMDAEMRLNGLDFSKAFDIHMAAFLMGRKNLIDKLNMEQIETAFENYDDQVDAFFEYLKSAMESDDGND